MFIQPGITTLQQQLLRYWNLFQQSIMSKKDNKQTALNDSFLSVSYKAAEENDIPQFLTGGTNGNLLSLFMANSQAGCWIYDEEDIIVFANKAYTESTGYTGNPAGKHLSEIFTGKVAEKLTARNKEVFASGKPGVYEHSYVRADGSTGYFMSSVFVFTGTNGKRYIGGQAIDITERRQMEKNHERYKFVINATSEAIWDYDIQTSDIYRSDAFYKISGYNKEAVENNLNWWIDKIHPEDKEAVQANIHNALNAGKINWEDEYRFLYADGTYHHIYDKGFAVYENGVAIRLIGAIQDITERKQLEQQLLNEQLKKQKLISQATIDAQEKERGMISAELHDSVNQLLMSARLHINAAKNNEKANELITKASDYLLMAVDEIRGLSHKLNSSIVKTLGLEPCMINICNNMYQFNDIEVTGDIQKQAIDKLSPEQQLVIFRIMQEQSSNIIKYSRAANATVSLTDKGKYCALVISDDGIGFDKNKQKSSGIGFVNIFNRVDAYNGKTEINTFPGNGCTLTISLPYIV